MNRNEYLSQAILTWAHPEIQEIIIVDWSSVVPVKFTDKRVRVLRVEDVGTWCLSLALNFGASQAKCDRLLKLDADSCLQPDFFKVHPEDQDVFYTGNWKNAANENEKHLNGIIYINRKNFNEIGGYNEHIRTYGWDDTDLYQRLTAAGLQRKDILRGTVNHIEHENSVRIASDIQLEIIKNMYIASELPWKPTSIRTTFTEAEPGTWVPVDLERNLPAPEIITKCTIMALRMILNEHGYTWDMTEALSREALVRLHRRRTWPKLILEPRNGLGNRLRALASAAVLSEAVNRNLIVVWKTDIHHSTSIMEHYKVDNLVVTSKTPTKAGQAYKVNVNSDNSGNAVNAKGEKYWDLSGKEDLYFSSACIFHHPQTSWQKECSWLQKLRTQDNISSLVTQYGVAFDIENCIGMHIRMGQDPAQYKFEDASSWQVNQRQSLAKYRRDSHYKYFVREMEKHWSRDTNQKFFVCADNEEVYRHLMAYYTLRLNRTLFWVDKKVYDRSKEQINGAIIDLCLLARCQCIYGSPWSSFTELAMRLSTQRIYIAGKHFGRQKFALLFYPESYNLGDDIQSIAAEGFLPTVDYLIPRDDQRQIAYDYNGKYLGTLDDIQRDIQTTIQTDEQTDKQDAPSTPAFVPSAAGSVPVIENGWFDGRMALFPPHKIFKPLFISFHLNESPGLFDTKTYSGLKGNVRLNDHMLDHDDTVKYFERNAVGRGVGTRDKHTLKIFRDKGIRAYHSCCLTLTLDANLFDSDLPFNRDIYVVDAHINETELYHKLVPEYIRDAAIPLTHCIKKLVDYRERKARSEELLRLYRHAKLVITNRLHCALPCIAFGTPVIFINSEMSSDPRFDDVLIKLLGPGNKLPDRWRWDQPFIPRSVKNLAKKISDELKDTVHDFMKRAVGASET